MQEIDFTLYADKAQSRVLAFTNQDDSIYDFTGSTVVMKLYLSTTPTEITGSINVVTGRVTFNFTTVHTDNVGIYEHLIEETKSDTSVVPLTRGNCNITTYLPVSSSIAAFLETELPADITPLESYVNQRVLYWRYFLMGAFGITEANVNIDSAWTMLTNALVAKLVAYDTLLLAARGNLLHILGGDYTSTTSSTSQGGIQEIETGPARVKYFPTGDTIQQVFNTSTNGTSVLDTLISDICGLASKLGVKVPMCKGNKIVMYPRYYQNEDWHLPTLDEEYDSDTTVPSQGSTED